MLLITVPFIVLYDINVQIFSHDSNMSSHMTMYSVFIMLFIVNVIIWVRIK